MVDQKYNLISFGGIKSKPDYRDIALSSVVVPITLPDAYEVDVKDIPIWNQRKLGACVGHAAAKYKQELDKEDTKTIIPLSSRFVYSICKALDGFLGEGTYPRLSMTVLRDYGCATEATMVNDTTLDHDSYIYNRNIANIPAQAMEEAKKYKIGSFAAVDISKDGIKSAIFQAYGCSMLMRVGNEWYTDVNGNITWEASKVLPVRPPNPMTSGHQVYVYKYETVGDDLKVYFINSWSEQWGLAGKGWFWLSQYKPFIDEAWTAIDIPQDLLDNVNNLPKPGEFKHNFSKNIKYGEQSTEVTALQTALKIDGVFTYPYVTGYFGSVTAKAVLDFQLKYAIPLSWYERYILAGKLVGPKTLSVLNQKFNK